MLWFILVLVFLTTLLLTYGMYYLFFKNKISIKTRLKLYVQNDGTGVNAQMIRPNFAIKKELRKVADLIRKIIPQKLYLESKRKKLAQAAVLMKPEEFVGICIISGVVLGLLIFSASNSILLPPPGFVAGFWIPNLFLESVKSKRAKKLNSQLPEALTIISNGLRAGFSINQAMSAASKELQEPISDEFGKVIRENSLGKHLETALLDMAKKVNDNDLDIFVTAMLIQRQVGGNLAEILENISKTIRERVRIRGEIKTLTSQSRFSAVVISVMPIAIAVVIGFLNPQYIRTLFTTQMGIMMLIGAVILDVLGIIALKKIVNIEI